MTAEIVVHIKDPKNPPVLKFPARCVNCGRPLETTMKASLNMGVQKRSRPVIMENVIPMCNECAEKERSVTKVTLVPFLAVGSVIGVLVFVIVALISPQGTTTQTLSLPFVFGGTAGLIAGVISGTVAEFVVKLLSTAFYGKLLAKRPLTVFSVFTDSEDIVGISFRFGEHRKSLKLIFENEDIAREFVILNPQEKK